jgi:hypothetical protein
MKQITCLHEGLRLCDILRTCYLIASVRVDSQRIDVEGNPSTINGCCSNDKGSDAGTMMMRDDYETNLSVSNCDCQV